jgi:hypothetical protein
MGRPESSLDFAERGAGFSLSDGRGPHLLVWALNRGGRAGSFSKEECPEHWAMLSIVPGLHPPGARRHWHSLSLDIANVPRGWGPTQNPC